ncbi:MAG: ankyrin repeat domain-containing protein, partial [Burkholderiales bacterium]|nr:ankyrin repeat domain-containing protein [Burkholderiales bacterium]
LAVSLLTTMNATAEVEVQPFYQFRDAFAAEDLREVDRLLHEYRRSGEPYPVDDWNTSLLHKAIHVGGKIRVQLIERLIAAGQDVNAAAHEGATPLHMAARFGCAECVPVLVRAGAKVGALNAGGETPLHEAGGKVVEALLAAGADPAARDRYGNVPLHRTFHPALLVVGIEVRNTDGLTPLHTAALDDSVSRLRALLEHGADPASRTLRPSHWRERHMSFAFGPGYEIPAKATALELARDRAHATRWNRQTHAEAIALLTPVSPSPRTWWQFWR